MFPNIEPENLWQSSISIDVLNSSVFTCAKLLEIYLNITPRFSFVILAKHFWKLCIIFFTLHNLFCDSLPHEMAVQHMEVFGRNMTKCKRKMHKGYEFFCKHFSEVATSHFFDRLQKLHGLTVRLSDYMSESASKREGFFKLCDYLHTLQASNTQPHTEPVIITKDNQTRRHIDTQLENSSAWTFLHHSANQIISTLNTGGHHSWIIKGLFVCLMGVCLVCHKKIT